MRRGTHCQTCSPAWVQSTMGSVLPRLYRKDAVIPFALGQKFPGMPTWDRGFARKHERQSTRKKEAASGLQTDRLGRVLDRQPARSGHHAVALDDGVRGKSHSPLPPGAEAPRPSSTGEARPVACREAASVRQAASAQPRGGPQDSLARVPACRRAQDH